MTTTPTTTMSVPTSRSPRVAKALAAKEAADRIAEAEAVAEAIAMGWADRILESVR